MRIGIISPYSLSVPGGVQGQVLGLARALRLLGQEARVLGPCDGPPPDIGVTPLGASLPVGGNGSIAPIAPDVSAQLRTIRALNDEAFDIIHLHEPIVPGPTQTALFTRPAPMIGTFHAAASDSASYRFLQPLARWGANRLDVRCAVSRDAEALARRALGGTYELTFNGVEIEGYVKADPWPTAGPTIVFIGRHEPRKGLSVLLDAMAELPADVHLWVAGEGPQTAELRARTAGDPRVEWLGRISDAEKASRLRGADVFCAPSLGGESFGVVLLEAMAASACVVASDLPGYANVARRGQDAVLVAPGDPRALAGALHTALTDGAQHRRLVASGDQRARTFSMERLADTYLDLYDRVLAERRRAGRRPAR